MTTILDTEGITVTEPGVYEMSNDTYHADPVPGGSLSCSGAKKLLPPSCPALFKHEQEHGRPDKKEFDLGTAAHMLALGAGTELVVIPGERWDTKEAKTKVAQARLAGKVPLKERDMDVVLAMAEKLKEHPLALALFDNGRPEQSLFWVDDESGIWRRARLDWLPTELHGRMIIPDYKTARSAEPEQFAKSAADYGYHQQHPWYTDAVEALGLAEDPAFLFVVQEKTAPYLVTICQLHAEDVRIGRMLNRRAITTYARCVEQGRWPGYSDDVEPIALPGWYRNRFTDSLT